MCCILFHPCCHNLIDLWWKSDTVRASCSHSAVALGTDMLELDCHLTKDEQVVVSHDANLRRSTGINAYISDLAYAVSYRPVTPEKYLKLNHLWQMS